MVQSVLQTESHDQFTEDLMKDAERSKKKQEYKRVEKVINQDPNSQGIIRLTISCAEY